MPKKEANFGHLDDTKCQRSDATNAGDAMAKPFNLPDVRDGLTHRDRIVPWCLYELQQQYGDRQIPTSMLYGRVVEHANMSVEDMKSIMVRFVNDWAVPACR